MNYRTPIIRRERPVKSTPSWKDHPFIIAVVSAGATATFMSGVVIPIVTAQLSSQVESLRTTISSNADTIRDLNQRVENSGKAYAEQKVELEATKTKERAALKLYSEARMSNPFTPGIGYPRGLEKVQIGTTFARLKDAYPDGKVEARGRWYVVTAVHPVFQRITFYIDDEAKIPTVTHILYFASNDVSPSWLADQFNAAFGVKVATTKDGDDVWKVNAKIGIKQNPKDNNFVLVPY